MELIDSPEAWPLIERRPVYEGYAISVHRDRITAPGHDDAFDRDVVEHVGAVGVLAVNDADEVLVVRQYRHPVGAVLVELPAGLKDTAGELAVETAKRELLEEGHVAARTWAPLISVQPSPGFSSEQQDVFLATDIVLDQRAADFEATHEEAQMERAWVPLEALVQAVLAGRIRNGLLATAVLALTALRHRDSLSEQRNPPE